MLVWEAMRNLFIHQRLCGVVCLFLLTFCQPEKGLTGSGPETWAA